MNLSNLIHIQYCYEYLINQIPFSLLLYSHIPTALVALFFGLYVLLKARSLPALNLFIICSTFAIWSIFDLISWFAFLGSPEMMFAWSLLDLLGLVMFCFGYYFLYSFLTGHDLPTWQKLIGVLLLLPAGVITLLGLNLENFDATICEATENSLAPLYLYFGQGMILLFIILLTVLLYRKAENAARKKEIVLTSAGLLLFLGFFFSANLAVAFLVNYEIGKYSYNYAIYGLFGMPVFLAYFGYLIVRYKAFNLKVFGAQGLIFALLALIGSEFAFVSSITNRILVTVTFVITGIIGVILIRSVRREINQREHIELLANDLRKSNKQQVALIRFITHQLKGFVGKSRNIFSMIQEGDYGKVPATMKPVVEEGFASATKGAQTIQEILNAANIKSGKVTYATDPFDFKELVETVVSNLKQNADEKGIVLSSDLPSEPILFTGDRMQMENAIKNLVDNTIKYTPKGTVKITLTSDGNSIRFMTEDTGVGITAEDMEHLFTEGGHGVESQKVNVDSTGFGLYIVKNVIEAHKGRVWAESEGAGKGSKFIVELPLT